MPRKPKTDPKFLIDDDVSVDDGVREIAGLVPWGANDPDVLNPFIHGGAVKKDDILFKHEGQNLKGEYTHPILVGGYNIQLTFDILQTVWGDVEWFNGIPLTVQQGFDALIMKGIEEGSGEFHISNHEFGKLRKLDKAGAKRQLENTLKTLYSFDITINKHDKEEPIYSHIRILDEFRILGKGIVYVSFSRYFSRLISRGKDGIGYHMPISLELIQISSKKYPYAYRLGKGILTHMRMNFDNSDEKYARCIEIKILLEHYVPELLQILDKTKATKARTIGKSFVTPLHDNLDAALDTFKQTFGFDHDDCSIVDTATGIELDEKQLFNYTALLSASLVLPRPCDWKNYNEAMYAYRQLRKKQREMEDRAHQKALQLKEQQKLATTPNTPHEAIQID